MYRVLSPEDVDAFMERGYVRVEEAFRREDALAAQKVVWSHLAERGVIEDDPSTWTEPLVRLNEGYTSPEFERCNTDRLADAIEDLVGRERLRRRRTDAWGWWPVNFSLAADRPWDVPRRGWHWDGQHFRHYVDSPEQGLLVLCLFSEVKPRGGGTLVVEGSHRVVARYLSRHPDGIEHRGAIDEVLGDHPWFRALTASPETDPSSPSERVARFMSPSDDGKGGSLRVAETTGGPGDVLLCHPFLFHATAPNHRRVPRFMCNRTAELVGRMRIAGPETADLSPVERSIRHALSV